MNKFFCIFFIIVFIFKTETVFSNNLIYDVNNIEVRGKINNDLDNKKLIETAFQKAFIIFINKILLNKDAVNLYKTKIGIIKDLILTYQIVKNERNDKKENFLTFNIKFDQKKISDFFAQRRISYADISNISLTLFPILIKQKDIFLYKENFFYENWTKIENTTEITDDNLITYNLALEDIEDFEYINKNKENLELIDVKKIISFDARKNYALLIIYFTEDKFRAYIKTLIENKEIDTDIDLKIYPESEVKSYEEAIFVLKEEISQIWKEQNLIDVNTPSFLDFFLETKKNNDYLKLRSVLDSINIVENYSVLEMTNEYSKIRLKYKGKVNKIKDKLIEQKINIKITDNIWRLRIN